MLLTEGDVGNLNTLRVYYCTTYLLKESEKVMACLH